MNSSEANSTDSAGNNCAPGHVALHGDENARAAVASKVDTPSEILALLSEDKSDTVKLAVARNSQTPHHIVAKLAKQGSAVVRAGLACDASTPLEILNELAEDDDDKIRANARQSRRVLVAYLDKESQGSTTIPRGEKPFGTLNPRWA